MGGQAANKLRRMKKKKCRSLVLVRPKSDYGEGLQTSGEVVEAVVRSKLNARVGALQDGGPGLLLHSLCQEANRICHPG